MASNTVIATQTLVIDEVQAKTKTDSDIKVTKFSLKSKRDLSKETLLKDQEHKWFYEKYRLKPLPIVLQLVFLVIAVHGLLTFPFLQHYKTTLWGIPVAMYSFFGIGGGVHRLWSHKAYKAKTPLKIILAVGYFLSAQQIYFRQWVNIHRVHHKYTDSDADPHNSKRGFFYSHMGWLMIDRPREVIEKFSMIDMSDIDADPVIKFCDKYFGRLAILLNLLAIALPVYAWNETWTISIWAAFIRYIYVLHATLSVNSFAHLYGVKPYDKKMNPVDNRYVSWMNGGEGWHNYHHVFPNDYRVSEIGGWHYDFTARLIGMFEKIGWAYDLKKPNEKLVEMTIRNRGDKTILKSLQT